MIFWKYISIYLVLSIVGGIGLLKASGKLDPIKQRENRIKYFMYLLLIVLMTACIIAGVTVYIWVVAILIFFCIRELASISGNLRKRGNSRWILYGALVYLAMMSGFLFSVVLSPERLLFLYTNVVVFDGFSQVVGQLLGKHKMVPKISPGKTWEGLLGGMVFMSLSYFILRGDAGSVMPVRDYFLVVLLALGGDLFASLIKRKAGIKDFSTLLPGQGGFLDRYDSLIAVFSGYGWIYLVMSL